MSVELLQLPPPPDGDMKPTRRLLSMSHLWEIFVRLKGPLAKNTKLEYTCIGNRFCKFLEGRELVPQTMVDWILFLQSRQFRRNGGMAYLSAGHINSQNVRIRSFLRWMQRMGYITFDLSATIPTLVAGARKQALMFTEEEYEKIKSYCAGRQWCQPHLWLIILGYRTGMSLIDCCYLRWKNVTLQENGPSYIDIYRIKTERLGEKALCTIPIVPFSDIHQWLMVLKKQEHLNYKRFDGITDFVHQDCPGLYECNFSRIGQDFKNIFLRAGIGKEKTFRNLRNSFCSNLVNSGTQIALVCKMTGHNNVKTLLRYLKPDRRALQDGLAKAMHYAASQAGTAKGSDGFDPCIPTPITQ